MPIAVLRARGQVMKLSFKMALLSVGNLLGVQKAELDRVEFYGKSMAGWMLIHWVLFQLAPPVVLCWASPNARLTARSPFTLATPMTLVQLGSEDLMIWFDDLIWCYLMPKSLHCSCCTDSWLSTLGCWLPAHFRQFAQSFRARWPGLAYGPAALESGKRWKNEENLGKSWKVRKIRKRENQRRIKKVSYFESCVTMLRKFNLCAFPVPNGPLSGHCQCPAQGRSSRPPCPEEHGCRRYCPHGGDNCLKAQKVLQQSCCIQDRSDKS